MYLNKISQTPGFHVNNKPSIGEVQHRLCPLVATEVEALLSVRDAGWLDQPEFEEAILQLFVNCDTTAALTV